MGDRLPHNYTFGHNYPNPFNPTSTMEYSVSGSFQVRIDVLDLLSRLIRTLVDDTRSAGTPSLLWGGKDRSGRSVATGVYFYRISSDYFNEVRKMMLLK